MPLRKRSSDPRYDTTLNCGPPDSDNPLTMVKRGPITVAVRYEMPMDPKSDFFLEVKVGNRRARTAFIKNYEIDVAVKELLEHLGFEPKVYSLAADMDEEYD